MIFDVVRHGRRMPPNPSAHASWKDESFLSPLSVEGMLQANQLGRRYQEENTKLVLGLFSPAPRAMTTLFMATAHAEIPRVELPKLFTPDGEDGDILNESFQDFGENILAYTQREHVFTKLKCFGQKAAAAIREQVAQANPHDGVVVVAGHAITNNFVAWALADFSVEASIICLDVRLRETDGFRVNGTRVEYIRRP